MKVLILSFAVCILCSCSNKKEGKPLDSIGSSVIFKNADNNTILSATSYSKEALVILERHKKKLKIILPNMILDEVEIYKKTTSEIEKQQVLAYNFDDMNHQMEIEREKGASTLIEKEVELNQIYFELFNELSLLNEKYKVTLINKNFYDFYDAGPIVLSEEVLIKIKELIIDEKKRVEIEKRQNNTDNATFALIVISNISGVFKNKAILSNITQAAKAFKNSKVLNENSQKITRISHSLMNRQMANFISNTFKNERSRASFATKSLVINTAAISGKMALKTLTPNQSSEFFKVIENKINGRIGDFSDGILVVHMQRVRDLIKKNSDILL